jgi:hypothetical protein
MQDEQLNRWLEISRRRPLTSEEAAAVEAELAGNADRLRAWLDDQRLTRCLRALPPSPLPSNFTAQVLQAIDRDKVAHLRPAAAVPWWAQWRRLIPRVALVTCLLLIVPIGVGRYQAHQRTRVAMAVNRITRSVQAAATATHLAPVEMLSDFKAIERMRGVAMAPDEELLASLEMPK